jgi:UDP-4-keto-D-QuiNAc 4-reductase
VKVALTGASGFIGRGVRAFLEGRGHHLIAVLRSETFDPAFDERRPISDLDDIEGLRKAFAGSDAVVHLAGKAHVMTRAENSAEEFTRVNVEGTMNVARAAADSGVRRFVFLSSIKVNGERTLPGHKFSADDHPAPRDAYARSKREAEDFLREFCPANGIEVVIIRPPLVYGSGVPGNFRSMMRWLNFGIPLPLAGIDNRRSLVARENLASLIVNCLENARAAGQIFLVSDGEDLSTPELLRKLGRAIGKPPRLFFVPEKVLRGAAALAGSGERIGRLCDSLQVDIAKTTNILGWSPPAGADGALAETARAYLAESDQRSELKGR